MNDIDRLYTEAAAALDAIVKYRAAERARNAKLERIDVITLRNASPSDDVWLGFWKALADAVPESDAICQTFKDTCDDMGVDKEGYPITEDDYRMSDVEFDYRHAIGWPQGFRA